MKLSLLSRLKYQGNFEEDSLRRYISCNPYQDVVAMCRFGRGCTMDLILIPSFVEIIQNMTNRG